jgi:hypothetical protein
MSRVWALLPAAVLAILATALIWLLHWLVLEDLEGELMGLDKDLSNLQQELQMQLSENVARRARLTLTGWAASAWFPGPAGARHSLQKGPNSALESVMHMAKRQGLEMRSVHPMRGEESEPQAGDGSGVTHTAIVRPPESMLVLDLFGSVAQAASFLAMHSGADAVGAQTAVLHHLQYARDTGGSSRRAGLWQMVMEFAPLANARVVSDTGILDRHDPRSAGAVRSGGQRWYLLVDADGKWQLSPLDNKNVDHRDAANEVR